MCLVDCLDCAYLTHLIAFFFHYVVFLKCKYDDSHLLSCLESAVFLNALCTCTVHISSFQSHVNDMLFIFISVCLFYSWQQVSCIPAMNWLVVVMFL